MCETTDCGGTERRTFLQRASAGIAIAALAGRGWAADLAGARGEPVTIPTPLGPVRGYLALPAKSRPAPAVLVMHGEIGLPNAHRLTADELAGAGFAALVIERFSRIPGFDWQAMKKDNEGERRFLTEAFAREERQESLGAVAFLKSHQRVARGPMGAVGFCGGGIRAVRLGVAAPEIGAVVSFYGPPALPSQYKHPTDPMTDLVDIARDVRAPLQIHYGTKDYAVREADVERLAAGARQAGAQVEVHAYSEATHAFYDRTNGRAFDPAAAASARARYLDFLRKHLVTEAGRASHGR